MKDMICVFDPGKKNFAWTLFRNFKPVKMGYLRSSEWFDPKQIWTIAHFMRVVDIVTRNCNIVVIERYTGRQAARGVSIERLVSMINTVMNITVIRKRAIVPIVPQYWKRQLPYDTAIKYARALGFMRKDLHFVDCILMFRTVVAPYKKITKLLQQGLEIYNRRKS
jgi:hypothetical protein